MLVTLSSSSMTQRTRWIKLFLHESKNEEEVAVDLECMIVILPWSVELDEGEVEMEGMRVLISFGL